MKFNELNMLKEAFLKEKHQGILRRTNLWSLLSVIGSKLMIDKQLNKDIEKEKRSLLEKIVKSASLNVEKTNKKLEEIKIALTCCGYEVKQVDIKSLSRVLVGSSETFGKVPFEVGLCFDPLMNVPYIPGSTIKGAVRSATFDILYNEELNKGASIKEVEEKINNECNKIFGGMIGKTQSVGLIGFTDAYPIKTGENNLLLYPDLMTPHYSEKVETELDVKPNPIIYFTIAPKTEFSFFMFYKREREGRKLSLSELLENLEKDPLGIVDRGLLYAFIRGVGAKTAVGYSIFEVLRYEKVS